MKKAVLLNDTSYENHHGCNIVIKNIEHNLLQRDIELIATNPIGINWKENNDFLKALEICDIVVVNGEGTIHHNSRYGLRLLEIVNATEKPCVLMNMTYQSNSDEYIELVRKFSRVYVRESMSQKELVHKGINATIVPDMTFYSSYHLSDQRDTNIYITDSHDIRLSETLYKIAKKVDIEFLPILSPFNKWSSFKSFVKKIKYSLVMHLGKLLSKSIPMKYSYQRYLDVCNEDVFVDKINHCSLLITARFHALCIAIQTFTPFIVLKSNTHKIEGMLHDMGFSENRIIQLSRLDELVKSIPLDISSFAFSTSEVQKISVYMKKAKEDIKYMFDEIAMLSGNK